MNSDASKKCNSCGGDILRDYKKNILICKECGKILKKDIKDQGPEWRSYDQEEREERSRSGPPITNLMHDKGLSTSIDWQNRDFNGRNLSPDQREKAYRIRRKHKRTRVKSGKDWSFIIASQEIQRLASNLFIPQKGEKIAAKIFRELSKEDYVQGRSIESLAAACLFIACRKSGIPRTFDEIIEVTSSERNSVTKDYRVIKRSLDIHLPPVDPVKYVSRFCSDLDTSQKVKMKTKEIVRKAKKERLTNGKSPVGIVGGAIYLASRMDGKNRTQYEIGKAVNMSEVTVRERYKELVEELGLEVEEN